MKNYTALVPFCLVMSVFAVANCGANIEGVFDEDTGRGGSSDGGSGPGGPVIIASVGSGLVVRATRVG